MSQQNVTPEPISDPNREARKRLEQHGGPAQYMTLRDHFAGQAMQSLVHAAIADDRDEMDVKVVAKAAYLIADAMIEVKRS